jgi:[acyl-carrier-protein] S-malonyltransferase
MLNVAGAYHSRLMERAYEELGAVLQHVPVQPPSFPVISNVTGEEVRTPIEIRRTLQDQVTGTVRWLDCVERLAALGCNFLSNWDRAACWQDYCSALAKTSV